MTSAYDLPSVQTLGVGERESDVSPSGEEYFIAEVKFPISSISLVSAVNRMAARTFREKRNHQQQKRVFLSTKFLMSTFTYTWIFENRVSKNINSFRSTTWQFKIIRLVQRPIKSLYLTPGSKLMVPRSIPP